MATTKYKRFTTPEGFSTKHRTVGVYAILNLTNGKAYIGSSVDVVGRWRLHRSLLLDGKHWTRHLQAAWDKYGADAFTLVLLDEIDAGMLREQEEAWISVADTCNRKYGYNGSPTTRHVTATPEGQQRRVEASRLFWANWREEGRSVSVKTRERLRQATLQAWEDGAYIDRSKPPSRPHIEETKVKIQAGHVAYRSAQTPEEKAKTDEIARANGRKFTGATADHARRSASQRARRERERQAKS